MVSIAGGRVSTSASSSASMTTRPWDDPRSGGAIAASTALPPNFSITNTTNISPDAYSFIETLEQHKWLVPYHPPSWKCQPDPTLSPIQMQHRYLECLGLWKRYRKFRERGYSFYPYPIPNFYQPTEVYQEQCYKTTNDENTPSCNQCQEPCHHYVFKLQCGHIYHFNCLIKIITTFYQKIEDNVDTKILFPSCPCCHQSIAM